MATKKAGKRVTKRTTVRQVIDRAIARMAAERADCTRASDPAAERIKSAMDTAWRGCGQTSDGLQKLVTDTPCEKANTRKVPESEQALSAMEGSLTALGASLSDLADRLAPILLPWPKSDGRASDEATPARSPISDRLRLHEANIVAIHLRLRDLLDRLDL